MDANRSALIRTAIRQMEEDYVAACKRLTFWEAQPSIPMPAADGSTYDFTAGQRSDAEREVGEVGRALDILKGKPHA